MSCDYCKYWITKEKLEYKEVYPFYIIHSVDTKCRSQNVKAKYGDDFGKSCVAFEENVK